jgi:hypothetical protein
MIQKRTYSCICYSTHWNCIFFRQQSQITGLLFDDLLGAPSAPVIDLEAPELIEVDSQCGEEENWGCSGLDDLRQQIAVPGSNLASLTGLFWLWRPCQDLLYALLYNKQISELGNAARHHPCLPHARFCWSINIEVQHWQRKHRS